MKSKFESTKLAKFEAFKVQNSSSILGGLLPTDCPVPSGGCSCNTAGGAMHDMFGNVVATYSSDTQNYNSDGSEEFNDYNWNTGA